MQYFKNNSFQRDLKSAGLDDAAIKTTLDDIFKERSISLGSKLYKIRGAKKVAGKAAALEAYFSGRNMNLSYFVHCLQRMSAII